MSRRVVSSGSGGKDSSKTRTSTGARTVRSVASSSSPAKGTENENAALVERSAPGAFVDARALDSEDLVSRTLEETSGPLGLVTRPKVVDFSARLKERRKANARVIAVRSLAALAAMAALAGLIWLLFFSPVLRLESSGISVSGANEWVSEAQVRGIADQQTGKSLLLVSSKDVVDQIKDIPGVTEAKASKSFPHGLDVTVSAQKPAAMLKAGDTLTAVDRQGRVLNSVEGASVDGIPVIEVNDVDRGLKNRAVRQALRILASLPESLRTQITKVSAKTQDSVTTELNGGQRRIVWGDASDLKLKKAVIDKIINDPNVIGDKTQVDVSAPLRPIIK